MGVDKRKYNKDTSRGSWSTNKRTKTKCFSVSRHRNEEEDSNKMTADQLREIVPKFQYFGVAQQTETLQCCVCCSERLVRGVLFKTEILNLCPLYWRLGGPQSRTGRTG
jgi:hypothetical protein